LFGKYTATDPGTSAQLGTAIDEAGKSFNDLGFVGLNELTFDPVCLWMLLQILPQFILMIAVLF
jgi:hypothetical protein